ncbi:MAG TPA: hypothetical protein VMW80_03090 [Candidatus Dormibacteraeota bacterium]|nr:hypothetical protein [Candidatus Dormibacteraeota bacterium]
MSRIRTIKPEFWEDEGNGRLSPLARLLFIATFNMADDEGRLRWTPAYLKASAFMYDEGIDVAALMRELEAGPIRAYDASGERLAVIVNFRKHQVINKPSASKLRTPPELLSEDSGNPTVAFREDSRPEGNGRERKGAGHARANPPADDEPKATAPSVAPLPASKPQPAQHVSAGDGVGSSATTCPKCHTTTIRQQRRKADGAPFVSCPDRRCNWTEDGTLADYLNRPKLRQRESLPEPPIPTRPIPEVELSPELQAKVAALGVHMGMWQ